jgi:hypothetical protein
MRRVKDAIVATRSTRSNVSFSPNVSKEEDRRLTSVSSSFSVAVGAFVVSPREGAPESDDGTDDETDDRAGATEHLRGGSSSLLTLSGTARKKRFPADPVQEMRPIDTRRCRPVRRYAGFRWGKRASIAAM